MNNNNKNNHLKKLTFTYQNVNGETFPRKNVPHTSEAMPQN